MVLWCRLKRNISSGASQGPRAALWAVTPLTGALVDVLGGRKRAEAHFVLRGGNMWPCGGHEAP